MARSMSCLHRAQLYSTTNADGLRTQQGDDQALQGPDEVVVALPSVLSVKASYI